MILCVTHRQSLLGMLTWKPFRRATHLIPRAAGPNATIILQSIGHAYFAARSDGQNRTTIIDV